MASLKDLRKSLYRREKVSLPEDKEVDFGPTDPISFEPEKEDRLSSFGKKRFLWILSVIIVLALSLSVFVFWRGFFAFTKNKVELSITAVENVDSGSEINWQVKILNKNRSVLKNGELVFTFPKNSLSPSTSLPISRTIRAIETLEARQSIEEEFKAIIIGGENTDKTASVTFRFQTEGSSLVFETTAQKLTKVGGSPIIMSSEGPEETLSGENVGVSFKLLNESARGFNDLRLRLEYPSGFKFSSASEELSDFNTVWSFDSILPSEEKNIELTGSLSGLSGEGKIFRAFLEFQEANRWQTLKEVSFRSNLASLPLTLDIKLAEEKNGAVFLDEELTYELSWRNNFDIPLTDLTLNANINGSLFDISTLQTNGSVDIKTFTVSWSAVQVPLLSSIRPGERGAVTFRIKTKSSFSNGTTEPTLGVSATIDSKTKPPGLTVQKLQVTKSLQTKIHGDIKLSTPVFYNEPSSTIKNSGPYPLVVGQDTTFTVHWGVQSFANNFKNVKIKAVLPSNITWADETTVSIGSDDFNFNPNNGEVSWEIDELRANSFEEAVFKITARPVPSQEDRLMPLLSETELFAEDNFTANKLEIVVQSLNSTLPDDPAGSGAAGRIQGAE